MQIQCIFNQIQCIFSAFLWDTQCESSAEIPCVSGGDVQGWRLGGRNRRSRRSALHWYCTGFGRTCTKNALKLHWILLKMHWKCTGFYAFLPQKCRCSLNPGHFGDPGRVWHRNLRDRRGRDTRPPGGLIKEGECTICNDFWFAFLGTQLFKHANTWFHFFLR